MIRLIIILSFLLLPIVAENHFVEANEMVIPEAKEVQGSKYPDYRELLAKDSQLSALCKKESSCNPEARNPKDTDGLEKLGMFQYDEDSFYDVNKVCKILPDLERLEVPNIIKDPLVQTRMTRCAIDSGQGWRWGLK